MTDLIKDCLNQATDVKADGRQDKHEFMLNKVRDSVKDLHRLDKNGKKQPVYDWRLGERLRLTVPVCRNCFAVSYGCTHTRTDAFCKEIRPVLHKYTMPNP